MNKWNLESTQSFTWPEFPSKPNENKDTIGDIDEFRQQLEKLI